MSTTTITLTLTVTDEERARLIARFIETANAVTGEVEDDGIPGDPNGSKVDQTGVVWDARYHGVGMTKNQDGSWRRKKGLSEQEKADADGYEAGCRGSSPVAAVAVGLVPTPVAPVAPVTAAPAADVPAFLQAGNFAPTPVMPAPAMPGLPVTAPALPVPPPAPSYAELIAVFEATIGRVGQPVIDANLARIYTEAGVTAEAGGLKLLETDENVRRLIKASLEALQPLAA
jgi:hypothetical protein